MKITTVVENTAHGGCRSAHGLAFYIETAKHRLMFDLGPDDTLFENASLLGVDIKAVDTVIISHGHYDHGGALKRFLRENETATVYIQRTAYESHYKRLAHLKKYIGLDVETMQNPRIKLLDGDFEIDDELSLFTSKTEDKIKSEANGTLCNADGLDDFRHEQSLLIHGEQTALFVGCGHSGVISILESAPKRPSVCIGGFHMYNPSLKKTVPQSQLQALSTALDGYGDVQFYTCHCTGHEAFDFLSERHKNVKYISCGERLTV